MTDHGNHSLILIDMVFNSKALWWFKVTMMLFQRSHTLIGVSFFLIKENEHLAVMSLKSLAISMTHGSMCIVVQDYLETGLVMVWLLNCYQRRWENYQKEIGDDPHSMMMFSTKQL